MGGELEGGAGRRFGAARRLLPDGSLPRSAAGVTVFFALVMAGCFSSGPGSGAPPTGPPAPIEVALGGSQCGNALLFQFLDYQETDAFLPAGFHPRDAAELLDVPAAAGQAAGVLTLVDCVGAKQGDSEAHQAFLGIFVERPLVAGLAVEAGLDYYEVERLAPPGGLTDLLGGLGWDGRNATVVVAEAAVEGTTVEGVVLEAGAPTYRFQGGAPLVMTLVDGPVRMWRVTPQGIGYIEYGFPLDARFGPGVCELASGSTGARLFGNTACPPGDPLVATFPSLSYEGRLRFILGGEAK